MAADRRIRKAAVTGASGFIGSELAVALAALGVEVVAMARDLSRVPKRDGVLPFECDITKKTTLADGLHSVDTVFHTAALVGGITHGEAALRSVNVEGTRNVVQVAEASGVGRFVHLSTVAVMGSIAGPRPIEESDEPNPKNHYGRTKLEAEFAARSSARSMELVIARPMWVFGELSPSTAKLFRNIARRRMVLVGKADNLVQPVYIHDLLKGLLRCGQAEDARQEVIQFAGPCAMTTRQMCAEVAHAVGSPEPHLHLPRWTAEIAAAVFEGVFARSGRKLPIDRDKIDFFRLHHSYSIAKAKRLLDWAPEYSFQEAGKRITAHLRATGVIR